MDVVFYCKEFALMMNSRAIWCYWVCPALFCLVLIHPTRFSNDLNRFYRYLWYIIRLLARATYRPIPLPENPTYVAHEDVTIIVPTIDAGEEFKGRFISLSTAL